MKIIKKLNIKKIFKSLKTGVLNLNIFFNLICIFFFITSFAANLTLTVTHIDNRRIPGHGSNVLVLNNVCETGDNFKTLIR